MPSPLQAEMHNRLLSLLTAEDFASLTPHLELIELPRGEVLFEAGGAIDYAYFLDSGIGSIIAASPEGLEVEAGLFGRDGVTPLALLLGADVSINRILIQVPGAGWRVAKTAFRTVMEGSETLRTLFLRYAETLFVQTSCTALSNAAHPVDERLARWVLMCDDRLNGDDMLLTHEFLSVMLAVRRPSVTNALHVLEGHGFIKSERGRVIVRDRKGLETFAADAYGKPEAVYRELIGAMS